MAKIIENKKGFKIIRIDRSELIERLAGYGCVGICDRCSLPSVAGYYIAVLNQWFCQNCFYDWYITAVNYPEDRRIEESNFNRMKSILNL